MKQTGEHVAMWRASEAPVIRVQLVPICWVLHACPYKAIDWLGLLCRAEASLAPLQQLNPYVTVTAMTSYLCEMSDLAFMREYQCVVVTDGTLALQTRLDEFCRYAHIKVGATVASCSRF